MSPQVIEKRFFVLDASVWVSRLVPQDEFHERIKSWMEEQYEAGGQFVSPALLLAEVGGAISRRTGDPALGRRVVSRLEKLPGLRIVEMDSELVREAARLAVDLGLHGADSLYVATASLLALPLITLDVDQRERASEKVLIHAIQ